MRRLNDVFHFFVFVAASLAALAGTLRLVLGPLSTPWTSIGTVSIAVVVGGMSIARLACNLGLHPLVYYGVPAATTWCVPPVVLGMTALQTLSYLALVICVPVALHAVFSCVLGWNEYLPDVRVRWRGDVVDR